MRIFCFYKTNGQITQVGQCADFDFDLQKPAAGQHKLELYSGLVSPNDFYIENNILVAIPPPPNELMSFDYESKSWVDNESKAIKLSDIKRKVLLQESDWTQMPDVEISTKTQWATYRQSLRDITDQPGYPYSIVWPTAPTA